jgi:ribosomal protein L11 methylase PrmA
VREQEGWHFRVRLADGTATESEGAHATREEALHALEEMLQRGNYALDVGTVVGTVSV